MSLFVDSISLIFTKISITLILTSKACLLFNTAANINSPCSVKAYGKKPPAIIRRPRSSKCRQMRAKLSLEGLTCFDACTLACSALLVHVIY